MAVFKKDTLMFLVLLFSSAEATNFSDPIICYVLDAVLLFYCIVFTALYFKLKFEKAKTFTIARDKSANGAEPPEEGQYEALVGQSNDDYQEIPRKSEPRKKKRKAKEPKRNAEEGIEMNPAPALPTRN